MKNDTRREAAYRSLIEPLSVADVARELGVPNSQVRCLIREGALRSKHGRVKGADLADYLASCRGL